MNIPSNILNSNEEVLLANLLSSTLKIQKENTNATSINTKLLYRASQSAFSAHKFHKNFDEKAATITIIHNEKDDICSNGLSYRFL